MGNKDTEKPGLIQHRLKPEVKRWIEEQAKEQERSQGWIANKILEEAYSRAKQKDGQNATT